jgi:uncharacterized membrane protein
MIARFRRIYGAGPAHLGLVLASFCVAGYAISRVVGVSHGLSILVWLGAAALLHDLVLFPLYAVLDRVLHLMAQWRRRRSPRTIPVVNYVRIPALVSALMLIVAFPTILRLAPHAYTSATGLHPDVFLWHWLALSGGVWMCSALMYAWRSLRARRLHALAQPIEHE